MDGLILLLLIIGWIVSASQKKKKKKATPPTPQKPAAVSPIVSRMEREQRIQQIRAEIEKRKARLEQEKEFFQPPEQLSFFQQEGKSIGEGGSMTFDSTEGECLCEPELEHERPVSTVSQTVYEGEIGREPLVDFSAKGVLQGFVMNEILTRPVQRKRTYR